MVKCWYDNAGTSFQSNASNFRARYLLGTVRGWEKERLADLLQLDGIFDTNLVEPAICIDTFAGRDIDSRHSLIETICLRQE